jgi:RND family efflux transporter MFP subunit
MKHDKPNSPRSAARPMLALLSLSILLALTGCAKKELPELPPAAGEGAPAATKIPTLKELDKEGPVLEKAVGTRAGTGSLQALNHAALGPKETGVLSTITVDEGDRVKKGQVLFRTDPVQAELAVEQAKAGLATLRVQQAQAQLDYDRTKSLRERGSVPADVLDQTKARLDVVTSQIAQANAQVSMAQRHLSNSTVTSPIDGVVSEKRMNVGETATLMPPSVVLVVQDIDVLELRARLPETALKHVREGAKIMVRFPATDETRPVTIKRIAPTVDVRTRTIEVVAEIPNADHRLKAGMLAEVAYTGTEAPSTTTVNVAVPAEKSAGGDRAAR